MRSLFWLLPFLMFLAHCAAAPTDKVDLKKAKTGLLLANGQTVSSATADDYNPQLIVRPDGYLMLFFGSNRTCAPCTANNYHIFSAVSTEPYDPYDYLPTFNTPVQMNNAGAEITLGTSRANFQPVWTQNSVVVYLNHGGQIRKVTIAAANYGTANTAGAPTIIGNGTVGASDRLLMVNPKDFTLLSVTSGNVLRSSSLITASAGTVINHPELRAANNAALAHYAYSGYTDAIFYSDNFGLSTGHFDYQDSEAFFFNQALSYEDLTLSFVSTFRTPDAANFDMVLFSAGTSTTSHDLYVVTTHTAADLYLLDGYPDFDEAAYYVGGATNYAPYRMYVYNTPVDGSMNGFFGGGVPAADALCNGAAGDVVAMPDYNVYYAAMIAEDTFGFRSPTLDIDWVLLPDTQYLRADGQPVKMTDSFGLLFPFNLTTAINPSVATVWTGMDTAWDETAGNNCNGWTDNSGGASGDQGASNSITSTSANNASPQLCNTTARFYCVEQPY